MSLLSPKELLQRSVRFMGPSCNYIIATTQIIFALQEAILPPHNTHPHLMLIYALLRLRTSREHTINMPGCESLVLEY